MSLFTEDKTYIHNLLQQLPLSQEQISRSVPVPNSAKPGYSHIYRNAFSPEKLIENIHPCLNTFDALFQNAVSLFGTNRCLGYRPKLDTGNGYDKNFTWTNYTDTNSSVVDIGSGIIAAVNNNPFGTITDTTTDFIVSIFSHNRPEWIITDLACCRYSITNTSLYDTLGPETSNYILSLTQSPIIICSYDKLQQLIQLKKDYKLDKLVCLVSMDAITPTDEIIAQGREAQIMVYDFIQLRKLGQIHTCQPITPTPDSIYSISFTSGTTGSNPKGVILTHRQAVAAITSCLSSIQIPPDAVSYCFLPLAHIYERMNAGFELAMGTAIGFPQDNNAANIIDDLHSLRPTFLTAVPRIYSKIESALKQQTINSTNQILAKVSGYVIDTKKQLQLNGKGGHIIYDNTLIKKIRSKIGFHNILVCCTGSAPISPQTVIFLKAVLGIGFIQGYGLTESFAGISLSNPYEADPGSCGPISITGEMRLMDLPNMGYTANDTSGPRGELCLRGPQITPGYYGDDVETSKVFDEDGWFHTGDIAKIDTQGRLYIIDRVKNFFKLAQGEYVTPEKIENIYLSQCPFISQIFVFGDSLKTFLIGIIGIEYESIKPFLIKHFNIVETEINTSAKLVEYINKPHHKKKLLSIMNKLIINSNLNGFEKLHNIYIDINPLTIERNLITPTFKLKRPIAGKFFKVVLEGLYEEGSLVRDGAESRL